MITFEHITLVAHADWSINPDKRWLAMAEKKGRSWHTHGLVQVSDPSSLFAFLQSTLHQPGTILAGFDFPIGLPRSYATAAGFESFLSALTLFGYREWLHFFSPAETPGQISIYRPFYPQKPGAAQRQHLEQGLGLPFSSLYRLCEVGHDNRRPACPLFWTMGGQQVGKAAICGWKTLIIPALNNPQQMISIWPFSGSLNDLCMPGNLVIVETYPAEFYGHLGLFPTKSRLSKRRCADRIQYASLLVSWADSHAVDLDDSVIHSIEGGFGDSLVGEDRFDALVGLFGMLNIIQGNHPTGEPLTGQISKIEGWIFGQETHG